MKTINKIITEVGTKYGAPMGRPNVGKKPIDKKVFDCKVKFVDYAYDAGGAYWGSPENLRVKYTKDLSYVEFYRTVKNE